MAAQLDRLSESLHRLIEQERFAEAQSILPDYVHELDRLLHTDEGEAALKQAMDTFHTALNKARAARAHISGELSDMSRARAYTGETVDSQSGWQLIG